MSIFSVLHNAGSALVRWMTRDDHGFVTRSNREQRAFLAAIARLPIRSGLERSYAQYRCQMFLVTPWKRVALHLLSVPALPVVILLGLWNGLRRHQGNTPRPGEKRAVYFHFQDEIVPASLREQYAFFAANKSLVFVPADLATAAGLMLSYPLRPYFTAKLLFKLGQYRANLEAFPGSDFVVSNEYSFSCSFLTDWCERHGIKHINVMHGEKLFYVRDAFVKFHRFYVWDRHYADLFTELCADPGQFAVEPPKFLLIQGAPPANPSNQPPRLTYYLQNSPPELLAKLRGRLETLAASYRVVVRPHPRYSDRAQVAAALQGFEIEDPSVGIGTSLLSSDLVVAAYSTVLYQAYLNGRPVAIDDLAQAGVYEELADMGYIMSRKPHLKLSKLLADPAARLPHGAGTSPSV